MVVSRNTFLPLGQAERNETTWSKVDVEKRVKISRSVSVKLSSSLEVVRKYVRRGVIPQKFYKLKLNDNDTF